VDTSVLVDFLRGKALPGAERLRRLEEEEVPFGIPAHCCQEVLQGAKDPREWALLLSYLETQRIFVPKDAWATHVRAARIFFDCRRRGITIRSSWDCLIAQVVLDEEATLLHDDDDFERIRKVRPLRTMRA